MSEITFKRLPRQRVSLKDKLKDDKQWGKDIVDALCLYGDDFSDDANNDYNRKLSNYRLYNNIIDQEDFERECNPLGIDVGQFKDEIMPYNKTYNKIQVLLGEELKRNVDFRAVTVDEIGIREKEAHKTELIRNWLISSIEERKNQIIQTFQEKNPPPQPNPQEQERAQQIMEDYQKQMMSEVERVLDPKEIDAYMATDYQTAKEITIQKIIKYLMKEYQIRDLMNDNFKHGCISGEEFAWVGVQGNQPVIKNINPLFIFYHKAPEVKYIQKGEYAGSKTRMTTADILNAFEEDLKEEDKEYLENTMLGLKHADRDLIDRKMKYQNRSLELEFERSTIDSEGSYGFSNGDDWDVYHVEWVSRAKVGFLTYFDDQGNQLTEIVSENFPLPPDVTKETTTNENGAKKTMYTFTDGSTLEWKWIPEVWEGTRIGNDIYLNIRKKSMQFRSVDNPFNVKLGYHGVVYNNMNAPTQSIMDRMKPFQYLYLIAYHKMKKLLARDRGQLFSLDLSMIPEELGLEKTLYYLEEMDLDLFNSLQNAETPGAAQRGKVTGTMSRSNMQHVLSYINLLQQLDYEIGEAAGVTKQREGQVATYETVSNAQQAIVQSSYITEVFFFIHFKLWEDVMTSLVECTQFAWKNDKTVKQFVLDDLSAQIINIDGKALYNADFGIYISNNLNDIDVINSLKQMVLPILQNEGKITDIIKIYKALSASELEREFDAQERDREKRQQQQQESQRQMQQQQIEAQMQAEEAKRQHALQLKQMELETKLRIEQMKLDQKYYDMDRDNNGISDFLEMEKMTKDSELKAKELDMKDKQHKENIKLQKEKLEVEKMKVKNSSNK